MMKTAPSDTDAGPIGAAPAALTGAHRRTLEAIFRHPAAHNLDWNDVVGLIGAIGEVHEEANGKFALEIAGARHLMHKPHAKDLSRSEVEDLRHFLTQAEISPERLSHAAARPNPEAPDLLIVVDHHGTEIFRLAIAGEDGLEPVITPNDPHHFLHHLTHRDQSRERGQRAPEVPAYYETIADAAAGGGRIVVAGHGEGKSNAAHHLVEYLKAHHRETWRRVVRHIDTDLSAMTPNQLRELARQALRD